jgi:hypothetical protein
LSSRTSSPRPGAELDQFLIAHATARRERDTPGFRQRILNEDNNSDPRIHRYWELTTALTGTTTAGAALPFAGDSEHASYDRGAANLSWRQLLQTNRVLGQFRSRFIGKVSPVHFFWGAMDLACTRFSGRSAPRHPGGAPNVGDWVMVEGYSRELSSCGFWPGVGDEGAFYTYAYPEPDGFADHSVSPASARYREDLGEYVLPYEVVRQAKDPDQTLLDFLQDTYEAAAIHAGWDRAALECDPNRWSAYQSRA